MIDTLFCRYYIVIIIKKGRQCKAGRQRFTPYQNEDPPKTINRKKDENDKTAEDEKERSAKASKKALTMLLKPDSPTPLNTGSARSFHRDTVLHRREA